MNLTIVQSQVYVKYIDCFTMTIKVAHPIGFESSFRMIPSETVSVSSLSLEVCGMFALNTAV